MSYRFVKVASYLPSYLDDFYRRYPKANVLPYDEQLSLLMSDRYGWSDYYCRHLRILGVDATEIVSNVRPLQQAWAREHGWRGRVGLELLLRQIMALAPDVVFLQDAYSVPPEWIRELRKQVGSLKLVLAWCCSPFTAEHLRTFREADALITCTPGFVKKFSDEGFSVSLINHAFEGSLLKEIDNNNSRAGSDIIFTGSIIAGPQFHDSRQRIIDRLLHTNMDVALYGTLAGNTRIKGYLKSRLYDVTRLLRSFGLSERVMRRTPVLARALAWDKRPEPARFAETVRARIKAPIYGLTMLQALAKAKVGLNIHIGAAGRYAGNIRMFETTGVGTCLLTDWKENLGDLFLVDKEIISYRSAEECLEKARWLLDHPVQREEIARAGQQRTLRDYSFENNARVLNHIVTKSLHQDRKTLPYVAS